MEAVANQAKAKSNPEIAIGSVADRRRRGSSALPSAFSWPSMPG